MFSHEVRVLPSSASQDGTIKLRSLLDYFQDTASLAVEDIEGSTSDLISRGYSWVLTRYEIEFLGKIPRIDDTFKISTYHDPDHGYNTLREFRVNSFDGTEIIRAKTSWLLVDINAQRPVKPVSNLPEILSRDTRPISPEFQEIKKIEDYGISKTLKYRVNYHDTDYNRHMNNAVYFEKVYDSLADVQPLKLKSIYASFRSGAKLGEFINLDFYDDDSNMILCRVKRDGINKPCAEFMMFKEE